jgi:hypothetical protein
VLAKLSEEEQLIIKPYCQHATSGVREAIDSTLSAADTKLQQCINNKWEVKVGNKIIPLRDKADEVIVFIHKFKD